MRLLVLLLALSAAFPAWAANGAVSSPLAFQIDAAASPEPGANLSRLVDSTNTAGVALGQWIRFDFGKNVTITSMAIANGWSGAFKAHGRVRKAHFTFEDGSTRTVTLKDVPGPQVVQLRGAGKSVKMAVESVYAGSSSSVPYISMVSFQGLDPSRRQVTLTGRFEGCVRSRSSSSWGGEEEPLYYCVRFRADDGRLLGCVDDLCFHPREMTNTRLKITGFIKEGDVLEVLEAVPVR